MTYIYLIWSTRRYWLSMGRKLSSVWSLFHDLITGAYFRGDDENVPVWHTREAVATLKSWYPSANIM